LTFWDSKRWTLSTVLSSLLSTDTIKLLIGMLSMKMTLQCKIIKAVIQWGCSKSERMQDLNKRLKPSVFEDLTGWPCIDQTYGIGHVG
jgi:hypothetical protein